ncbi:MAG: DUF3560 domain-containing protein [Candidatus Aminicenantes bacterium]|nr:DUF3560 domain-containing protein [Candidatus Aminicenantes bacterium]
MRSDYYEKKQDRIDSYKERAEKAREESSRQFDSSKEISDHIPLGQPILVGHHSERRHRNDIKKIDRHMRKSIEAQGKAEYYDHKAEAAERNRAISSDDPDALQKLREKLSGLEELRARMKEVNADFRKCKKDVDKMTTLNDKEKAALKEGLSNDWRQNPKPFEQYQFQNLSGKIRQVKLRIKKLEAEKDEQTQVIPFDGGKIVDNVEDNRLQIYFDEKPSEEKRKELKERGYRWAPSVKCWQRYRKFWALIDAKKLVGIEEE